MLSQVVPALVHHLFPRVSKALWHSLGGSTHRISNKRSICFQPEQADLCNPVQLRQQALQVQCLQGQPVQWARREDGQQQPGLACSEGQQDSGPPSGLAWGAERASLHGSTGPVQPAQHRLVHSATESGSGQHEAVLPTLSFRAASGHYDIGQAALIEGHGLSWTRYLPRDADGNLQEPELAWAALHHAAAPAPLLHPSTSMVTYTGSKHTASECAPQQQEVVEEKPSAWPHELSQCRRACAPHRARTSVAEAAAAAPAAQQQSFRQDTLAQHLHHSGSRLQAASDAHPGRSMGAEQCRFDALMEGPAAMPESRRAQVGSLRTHRPQQSRCQGHAAPPDPPVSIPHFPQQSVYASTPPLSLPCQGMLPSNPIGPSTTPAHVPSAVAGSGAGQCRHFNSDAAEQGPTRVSDRIKGCKSLNELLGLWQVSRSEMKASHMALLSAQAVKLRRDGLYTGMGDFDAMMMTRRIITVIAKRVQLEACTVAELELLLSSWAGLAGMGSSSLWYPPTHVLHAVVRCLRPDPNQTTPADNTPATRLHTVPPQTTLVDNTSAIRLNAISTFSSPLEHSPSATRLSAIPYPGLPGAAVQQQSGSSSSCSSNTSDTSSFGCGSVTSNSSTRDNSSKSSNSGNNGSGDNSSGRSTHATRGGWQAHPLQEGLCLCEHTRAELQRSTQPMMSSEGVESSKQPALFPEGVESSKLPELPPQKMENSKQFMRSSEGVENSKQPSLSPEGADKHLANRAGGFFGDKLKTASCSSLASISMSLYKLQHLDHNMLHLVAQVATKKAKHGSVGDLATLAYVLAKNDSRDCMVYETIAQAAVPQIMQAPEPEHVVQLLHSLSQVGVHNANLLDAVAQDVVARGAAYAHWAPRIAHVYANAGRDHHLLFEALAAMGLHTQGELSLGLWSQLISAFARLGRNSPELCVAASRQASVSVQHTLLQLGQGPRIAAALGIKQAPSGEWLTNPGTWHVQVLRELMAHTQAWSPVQEHTSQCAGRRAKRKAYWERYRDSKAQGADHPEQQQQQQQQKILDRQDVGSPHDFEDSIAMNQRGDRGAQSQAGRHQQGSGVAQVPSQPSQAGRHQQGSTVTQLSVQSSLRSDVLQGSAAAQVSSQPGQTGSLRQGSLTTTPVPVQSSPRSSQQLHAKRQRQQQRQEQRRQQLLGMQLRGGGVVNGAHVERPKALATINLRVPVQRLEVVRSLCGLMHGLQIMGHPYDRDFMTLVCCALKSLCEKQAMDGASPHEVRPLHDHEVAHNMVQAISTCAQLRHYDNWLMGEAARLLVHLASSSSSGGSIGSIHGVCELEHTSAAFDSGLGLQDGAAKQGAGWLDAQQEQALLLIQLLQAVADLEGPNFHKLLLKRLRNQPSHGQHRQAAAAGAEEPTQQWSRHGQHNRGVVGQQRQHLQENHHQQEQHQEQQQHQQEEQQQQRQQHARIEQQQPHSQMQGQEEREARRKIEEEEEKEVRQQAALVLGQAVQLLARAHAAFTPHQLCDMLGALAHLELCPWREVVHPALCQLAEMCQLKPRKWTAAGGKGPASMALDLVQELMHGGYSKDKLEARQKAQLYQMFLVAQIEGREHEFKEAVGSWDVLRDARATWHAAQPSMPKNVPKVLRRCLESKLQLWGLIMDDFRMQDGSMDVELCSRGPDSNRLLAFKVLGPEQGLASEISARPMGHMAWLSRCLERRGVDCVILTWYEYQMAVDFRAAIAEGQRKGFAVDPERLPDFRGGLDVLLKKKVAKRLQVPPLPPILSAFPS